jgi:hypothetical protein
MVLLFGRGRQAEGISTTERGDDREGQCGTPASTRGARRVTPRDVRIDPPG